MINIDEKKMSFHIEQSKAMNKNYVAVEQKQSSVSFNYEIDDDVDFTILSSLKQRFGIEDINNIPKFSDAVIKSEDLLQLKSEFGDTVVYDSKTPPEAAEDALISFETIGGIQKHDWIEIFNLDDMHKNDIEIHSGFRIYYNTTKKEISRAECYFGNLDDFKMTMDSVSAGTMPLDLLAGIYMDYKDKIGKLDMDEENKKLLYDSLEKRFKIRVQRCAEYVQKRAYEVKNGLYDLTGKTNEGHEINKIVDFYKDFGLAYVDAEKENRDPKDAIKEAFKKLSEKWDVSRMMYVIDYYSKKKR